ncbi:alpha/beta hydrolase [Iningainema sp. BLCCT55]|uniref:Alpha/beta hydrolase n=2 Tax=Iningainema TaxID=1932705 RepID=A0A8J6XY77_9CYAN|nr:alpha/beta hydrolase [Iningainema tapete]MBD2775228.1 alpha/beta hydrolase [Iningainema tapete BLCC-T55]
MGVGLLCALAITQSNTNNSAQAAETAVLRIGPLEESITVTELEKIAETGKAPEGYESYSKRLSHAQRSQVLTALRTKFPVNLLYIDKLLNSKVGSTILQDLSTVIAREDNAGMQALRSGIIRGSTAPGGLSIASFIKAYPSERIIIDVEQAFKVAGNLNTSFKQTQQFITAIAPQLERKLTQINPPFDPSQTGSAQVQVLNFNWKDTKRQRQIPVDIYWSKDANNTKPLIVFSHGFSSLRTDMRYLAEHLASHGYVVAALEHPGSNKAYDNLATQGKVRIIKPQEFLERPRDISFVLDQLEKLNKTANNPLSGKLKVDQTILVGHSLGGGTTLSIAGAELQIDYLKKRCQKNLASVNYAEGLQCAAQALPKNSYQLRDTRVKRAIALNPVSSLMFGETGLEKVQVPLLMLASSADKSTPALTEQIIGFNKIPRDKWLVGIVGATHASVKDPSTTQDEATKPSTAFAGDEVFGEQAVDIRKYIKAITLAFAAQMTTEADKYAIFLTPEYAQSASTQAFPIHLVREIPQDAMTVVKQFVNKSSQ